MGVFVSDFVSARSSPYRPEPPGEGRYGLRGQIQSQIRYKNTHMIIILSLMYCDLYWQPPNIWNKVNLFIKYHIQGIVRVYQWVRNAILL